MLGGIGLLMAKEAVPSIIAMKQGKRPRARKRRHHPLVSALPMRWRFYRSGLYISPLAPFLLGVLSGILTMLLGVGGGFIMVPAMRSEEHTSELQSLMRISYAVFCLKKKNTNHKQYHN